MKKKMLFLAALLTVVTATAFAQRNLEMKDLSTSRDVFSGKDTEAGIVVSCPGNIELTFESTHDKEVDVYNKEMKGEEMFYYLRFNTGKKYRGRKLTIRTQEYAPIVLSAELEPKALKRYQLIDPDVEFVYGCYYEYRKRGIEFFQQGMYNEAKEQYNIAKECSDAPEGSNLDELIANVDSINLYRRQAEESASLLDYNMAAEYYSRILMLNPSDTYASNKRTECQLLNSTDCKKYYDMAEYYFEQGENQKALDLYQKVIDMNCSNATQASEQAKRVRTLMQNRKQHSNVITFEYGGDKAMYGISWGTYKTKKVGRYYKISLHPDLFDAIRSEYKDTKKAEATLLPFGWTVCPVPKYPYAWIFFGVGYTGVFRYENENLADDNDVYPLYNGEYDNYTWKSGHYVDGNNNIMYADDGTTPLEKPKLKVYSCISPEIGVAVKVSYFTLRYTFQYRFSLKSEWEDRFSQTCHSIGIGFCY